MRATDFIFESKTYFPALVTDILLAVPNALEIWFHGSRARGTNRNNSDWDIQVIVPDNIRGGSYLDVVIKLQELEEQYNNFDIQPGHIGDLINNIARTEGQLLWSSRTNKASTDAGTADSTYQTESKKWKTMRAKEFIQEGLRVDVPNEEWLKSKQEYAASKGRDRFGAPYMGTVTALFREPIKVRVDVLKKLPGMRNEQGQVRKDDLKAIKDIMQQTGKLPLLDNGEEYVPFINVAYNGEAWVNEGNHRIMAAAELGWDMLPVEIRYFDGGERVDSGPLYPVKLSTELNESWSKKYKRSIDCSHPRGFSQKAHCAGRRARQAGKKTKSSSVSESNYGKYWCSTDKKWKYRKGPKQSRTVDEMAGEIHGGVRHALEDKGYRYLGGGIDKQAWLEPGTGQVLLVFGYRGKGEDFSPDQRMFINWINYCNENRNNPHLPRFSGFESFEFHGKKYIQARMEKLSKIPLDARWVVTHLTFDEFKTLNVKQAMEKLSVWAHDDKMRLGSPSDTKPISAEYAIELLGGVKRAKSLLQTVFAVKQFAAEHGYEMDLHQDNYMQRDNKTIVVNDPFVIWLDN